MNYVEIINLIFSIIGALFSLYLLHFVFFAFSGLFHHKKYPAAEEKCRYLVLCSAKNEENVIGRLIQSIREADYPQEKLDICIVAHNCTDKTAEVAASLGTKVIVDNNKAERTLGYAYKYAFEHLDNLSSYDGVIVFNADNTVAKDFFQKINDTFVYYGKKDAVTTFRHSLNMNDAVLPVVYSYYFSTSCLLGFSGRNNFGVSSRITGCGFLVPVSYLSNGWNYFSMTEDIEFSADSVLQGRTIRYCYDADFYDEQPTKFKTMWFQRLRWAKGQQVVSAMYLGKLFKALFSKDHKNKVSLFVSLSFHSFLVLAITFLFLLQLLLLLLSPAFGVSLYDAFLYWDSNASTFQNLFVSLRTGMLIGFAKTVVLFVINGYLAGIGVLIAGRSKDKGYNVPKRILGFLIFPLFLALHFPLEWVSLASRKVEWKKIPHGDTE